MQDPNQMSSSLLAIPKRMTLGFGTPADKHAGPRSRLRLRRLGLPHSPLPGCLCCAGNSASLC